MGPPLQVVHKVWLHKGQCFVRFFSAWVHVWAENRTKFEWRPFFLIFFCSSPNFGQKIEPNFSEDLFFLFFFCSSPNFGRKIGLILDGTISDSDLCSSQIFWSSWPPLFKILRTLLGLFYTVRSKLQKFLRTYVEGVYTIQNGAYERNGLTAYSVGGHIIVLNWMMEITDLMQFFVVLIKFGSDYASREVALCIW